MARQTSVGNGAPSSIEGMIEGIGGLGANVVTLAVLQVRLAAADLRETTARVLPALASLAVLVPLAFASFAGALFGLAFWLSSALGLSMAAALGLAALGGLVISGLLAILIWRRLRVSLVGFQRSREELERNITWLGTVLTQSGR